MYWIYGGLFIPRIGIPEMRFETLAGILLLFLGKCSRKTIVLSVTNLAILQFFFSLFASRVYLAPLTISFHLPVHSLVHGPELLAPISARRTEHGLLCFARQNSAYKIFMCNPATSPVECNQQQQQQQHDEEEEKKEENWSISDNRQRCDDVGTTLNMLLSTHHQTSNRKSLYSYSAPLHSLLPCHFLK